jgi:alkylhydroperoxidase/carboxymuconolactone decarboxylase family protein YurZ
MSAPETLSPLEERFRAVCLKLWGEQNGEATYRWIKQTRPPHFHAMAMQVMTPIWESDRLDLRTRILCCIAVFTAQHRTEVEFFMKMAAHHGIPFHEVEEVLLLTGLEAGFPSAEMAIQFLEKAYAEAGVAPAR